MAIYHLSFNILQRSQGKSSCAEAAYQARCKIKDQRTGKTFDYRHRTGLYHHLILSPPSVPAHIIESTSALWNEVERIELRKDAQTARYFIVAIPVELNNDDKVKLVVDYCQKNFVSDGMIADISFHSFDGTNPHAHVMLTLREINADGFGKKNRSWNEHTLMDKWRSSWTEMSNNILEKAGFENRIDHRSIEAQRKEYIELARIADESNDTDMNRKHLAQVIELTRKPLTRIHRCHWYSYEGRALRAAETRQSLIAKQNANDFRQSFKG